MATNCIRQYSSSSSGSPKIVARRPKKENGGDEFSTYRNLCEVRMRRLERYKKAKSFCSLEDETAGSSGLSSMGSTTSSTTDSIPPSHCHSNSMSDPLPMPSKSADRPASQVSSANSVVESQFEVLREKMISLMENDVQLLQKLVKLGETIQELRNNKPIQRASSETSLSSSLGEEEEDNWRPLEQRENNFSASMSAITRLYVDDDPPAQNVQYFSRKNSVLRIPIPPRSSNRMLGNKKIPRRPSELAKSRLHLEDSGHSSGGSSSDSPPQHSPTATSDSLSSRSTLSGRLSSPIFEEIKIPRVSAGHRVSLPVGHLPATRYTKYSRNGSSDSGIREDGSKSPPLVD